MLIGLASFRLASLLVNEDGPGGILELLRTRVGLREGEVTGFLPSLFSCIWCMSVYTTVVAYVVWEIEPTVVMVIAAMSIPIIVNRFLQS